MKTDTIFYRLFQSFPSIFFELIGEHPSESADYELISVEIGEISPTINSIFLPAPGCHHKSIYFVEVEFQPNPNLYSGLFADIFHYLYLNHAPNDWRAVVVYLTRGMEVGETKAYRELLESRHVKRIYLDELDTATELSIGIETVKLAKDAISSRYAIAPEEMVVKRAKELISKARQEIDTEFGNRELIQLIETIVVYKFPDKSREEIEQMLRFSDLAPTHSTARDSSPWLTDQVLFRGLNACCI